MSECTIIVQGPLNEYSLDHLHNYAKFGPVIVVGWDNAPPAMLATARERCRESGARLVLLPPPSPEACLNPQNVFLQATSTTAGLERTETRFAAKFRSDEFYEDLSEMIRRIRNEPERIWSSSVFFRCDKKHPLHCGDHIIAGDTGLLLQGFRSVRTTCTVMPPIPIDWQPLPEQLITRSLLLAKGVHPMFRRTRDAMVQHFGPLSLNLFGKLACKIHLPQTKVITRKYIFHDDRKLIDGSGRCVHDSIDEL